MDFLDSGLSTRVSLEVTHPVQHQQQQSQNSSWQLATGSWKLHLGPPVCNSSTRSQRGRQNFLITFLCGEGHVVISVRESTRYPSILLSSSSPQMVSIPRGIVRELLKFHATFSLAAVGGGEIPKSFAGFTGYAVKGERGGRCGLYEDNLLQHILASHSCGESIKCLCCDRWQMVLNGGESS